MGVDLTLGGAVTYLSDELNGGENMVNSYDWGRQIQLSFYSGPWPFIGPNGEEPAPEWVSLGWNPIQSGDAGGNRSQTVFYEKRGDNVIFLRCILMAAQTGVASECFFECLYTLKDNDQDGARSQRLIGWFTSSSQEMPAIYTNLQYMLLTYLGISPSRSTHHHPRGQRRFGYSGRTSTHQKAKRPVDDSGLRVGVSSHR